MLLNPVPLVGAGKLFLPIGIVLGGQPDRQLSELSVNGLPIHLLFGIPAFVQRLRVVALFVLGHEVDSWKRFFLNDESAPFRPFGMTFQDNLATFSNRFQKAHCRSPLASKTRVNPVKGTALNSA